ncbi:MAG: PAS domain-containing protein [Paracoccaceae bacterium]
MERETDQFGTVVTSGQNRVNARQITAELRAYWEGLRQGRQAVPSRAEVDPRGIDRALEYSFILERVAPGMGRFRLSWHASERPDGHGSARHA